MKIIWIGGNHPRHLYYINTIQNEFDLSGAIVEMRENIIPCPPTDISELDRKNFIRHFENRNKAEKKYFGMPSLPNCPRLELDKGNLNSAKSADFVKTIGPDLVLIFGCSLIKEPLFSALPPHAINLHLGISPRYRGAAALFWPFYFMEPSYAGSTFHYIVSEPDAGEVIHQVTPALDPKDGIHDVACKTIVASAEAMIRLLRIFKANGSWQRYRQKGTGKNFLETDFKPEHLRVIYDFFNDDMARQYLEGKLKSKRPNLIRQF